MEKEALKNIFSFLEKNDNRNAPLLWKLENDIPLTKEDLNVKGDFAPFFPRINSLPKGLKVGGDLDLSQVELTSLPEGLEVGGYLSLTHSDIESLPKGLKVGGNLIITDTPLAKLSDDELIEMIKPGFIEGEIFK